MKEKIKSNIEFSQATDEKVVQPIFQTRDINLAAYLKLKGYQISNCVKEWSKVLFWFIDDDQKKREEDMYAFYNDEWWFQSYTNAWKDLKSLLHSLGVEK